MRAPNKTIWEIGHDRFGRRATLTREGADWTIEIEPCSQLDDGAIIHNLSTALILEAAEIAKESR